MRERWSPPAAVRGREVQGGEAPMGASPPPWVLGAGRAGPPGLGPGVLPWAPRHPKGSLNRPKGSPNCPRGHQATPKGCQTTPTGSPSYPKGHPTTPKVTKPPQKVGLCHPEWGWGRGGNEQGSRSMEVSFHSHQAPTEVQNLRCLLINSAENS